MEKKHRIFIAINLPPDFKKMLVGRQEKLAPHFEVNGIELARWTKPDNLHITLEFLGYLTDEEINDLCHIVGEVASRHESFSIGFNEIAYGPKGKMPYKMIWAIGKKSKELLDLRQDLEKSLLEKVRFMSEGKMFSPHITLARLNSFAIRQMDQTEIPEVSESIDLFFSVESTEVMESELKRGGPIYTILESHQLK